MIEAGTGTGKSVAYLLPAVLHAVEHGEPVVVSTNTIALQDQLFRKDLPDLRRSLTQMAKDDPSLKDAANFEAALLKGRLELPVPASLVHRATFGGSSSGRGCAACQDPDVGPTDRDWRSRRASSATRRAGLLVETCRGRGRMRAWQMRLSSSKSVLPVSSAT